MAARKSAGSAPAAHQVLPVRPDEEPWTSEEVAEIQAVLARDIHGLEREISIVEDDIAALIDDAGAESGDDSADAGVKAFEREQELTVANNARLLLEQNRHAMERLDQGGYGICESCGEPIGKFRLQAAPRATLCVTCKQKQERH
ncbi:MAG TPA: TraR/DksA C4-type zinc finger protein [Dermatophilaceae bacterium]|jgi:RNA polymerase-binding protein DksA|nr:TraR/DksA C4-type zinc finger protein [Dermatophilaceae bacterium]